MDPNLLIVKRTKLVFPELSYKISGLLFKVHNDLGRFCKERLYGNALEKLLVEGKIPFEREKKLDIKTDGFFVTKNYAEFVIDNKIIVELKSKRMIERGDYIQTLRYLQLFNLPLALVVNFGQKFLKPKRILNSNPNKY